MGKKATPDQMLLKAVLEPRKPGALEQIAKACAAGANPNGIVPETSASTGYVHGGSTLLTHSVREEASFAAKSLLDAGADPNLADENGWTPWMASSLIDDSKQRKIRAALSDAGATPDGEHIGALARALFAGDLAAAESLVQSPNDLRVLTTFRVDLVGRAAADQNTAVLTFLLEGGMKPTSTHLGNAARNRYLEGIDLLLEHGVPPEDPTDEETLLMEVAAGGVLEIVERLVAAGADVNRLGHGDIMWTASFYAESAGHDKVAQWLIDRMDPDLLAQQAAVRESRKGPFSSLYDKATAGEGVTTDDLVAALTRWDKAHGVSLNEVATNELTITFGSLPEKGSELYAEILEVCPELAETADQLCSQLASSKKTLSFWWD